MGEKGIWKERESIRFPFFPYAFFPWGKMGKMGLEPPPPQYNSCTSYPASFSTPLISSSSLPHSVNKLKLTPQEFKNNAHKVYGETNA